jgi:hypothetical protein
MRKYKRIAAICSKKAQYRSLEASISLSQSVSHSRTEFVFSLEIAPRFRHGFAPLPHFSYYHFGGNVCWVLFLWELLLSLPTHILNSIQPILARRMDQFFPLTRQLFYSQMITWKKIVPVIIKHKNFTIDRVNQLLLIYYWSTSCENYFKDTFFL